MEDIVNTTISFVGGVNTVISTNPSYRRHVVVIYMHVHVQDSAVPSYTEDIMTT
jgi:hypothetical protein